MSAAGGNLGSPVCVLGFGRSGTSLTMRLLNLLGVEIGPQEDLLAPGEADNPRGYWEPRWMVELNEEILAKLGTVWWRPLQAEPGWERSSDFDELRERARRLLEEKFGGAPLWGWKDPRTTLTLPFWKELVPDARYVICLRNPADAISSIQRRPDPQLPIGAWGDLWLEYTARALQETHGCPRTLVFYEDFFQDAPEQLAVIASLLDLRLLEQDGLQQRLLEEIAQDLRHHATSSHELAATWGVSSTTRTLFLALRAAEDARRAASGRDKQMPEAIRRIAPELWRDRRMFTDLHSAFAQAQQTTAGLKEEQRKLAEAVSRARDEHSEAQAALSALDGQLERQRTVLEGVQSSISWRVTAPLRAVKRAIRGLKPDRRGSVIPARDQSLLAGMSVSQVWWFALILSMMIAATDAIFTHVILITLLVAGPFCGLLTGRWARTATAGIWAVVLAVVLGFPDQIWGTSTQLVDLGTVAAAALMSTSAATLIERRRYHVHDDLQTPL